MATLKKELRDILDRYGIDYRDKDKLWDCHGTLVLYHKAYEIIAAQEKIRFELPLVLEANGVNGSVALCVMASMGDRKEWATGEASPKNCKNAYPYAMAEKRAKDRVVAKLVGLAAYVYSEDEAEEFKSAPRTAVEHGPSQDQQRELAAMAAFKLAIDGVDTDALLTSWWNQHKPEIDKLSDTAYQAVIDHAKARRKEINQPKGKAA